MNYLANSIVKLFFEPDKKGTSFVLPTRELLKVPKDQFEANGTLAERSEEKFSYVNAQAEKVSYADGTSDGLTIRLYVKAPGNQKYTWRTGAKERGHIGSEKDFRNFEATIYIRVHDYNHSHTSTSWIIRGGEHVGSHDPRASCIGLQVPYGNFQATVFKELDHPDYDFINVDRKFDYSIEENKWVALKAISFLDLDKKRTRNYLYLDTDPLDEAHQPQNNFRLYSEWIDNDGVSTGQYNQAALWAGWVTTFRVDGWKNMDVAHLSVFEIKASDN